MDKFRSFLHSGGRPNRTCAVKPGAAVITVFIMALSAASAFSELTWHTPPLPDDASPVAVLRYYSEHDILYLTHLWIALYV